MKRPSAVALFTLSLLIGVLGTLAAIGTRSPAVAQDATPSAATTHPIVGAWLLRIDIFEETDPPHLVIYHADGTYTDSGIGRTGGIGVWEAIAEDTVVTNVVFHSEDEDGNIGLTRIHTESTVDESGNTYTSEYTRELIAADGTSSGELGPGTGTAERLTIEPTGEPVGPMTQAEGTPSA